MAPRFSLSLSFSATSWPVPCSVTCTGAGDPPDSFLKYIEYLGGPVALCLSRSFLFPSFGPGMNHLTLRGLVCDLGPPSLGPVCLSILLMGFSGHSGDSERVCSCFRGPLERMTDQLTLLGLVGQLFPSSTDPVSLVNFKNLLVSSILNTYTVLSSTSGPGLMLRLVFGPLPPSGPVGLRISTSLTVLPTCFPGLRADTLSESGGAVWMESCRCSAPGRSLTPWGHTSRLLTTPGSWLRDVVVS
jgi:hypothetical protein